MFRNIAKTNDLIVSYLTFIRWVCEISRLKINANKKEKYCRRKIPCADNIQSGMGFCIIPTKN